MSNQVNIQEIGDEAIYVKWPGETESPTPKSGRELDIPAGYKELRRITDPTGRVIWAHKWRINATSGTGGTASANPTRVKDGKTSTLSASASSGYAFSRWSDGDTSPERTLTNIKDNISLQAFFEQIQYPYSFVNDDNSILKRGFVTYGQTPVYNGNPRLLQPVNKQSGYTYSFWAWSPVPSAITTQDEHIYKATYTSSTISYNITVNPNGGSGGSANPDSYSISSSPQYSSLTRPTAPANKEFSYWTTTKGSVSGNTLTIPANTTDNITVIAYWKDVQPETVTIKLTIKRIDDSTKSGAEAKGRIIQGSSKSSDSIPGSSPGSSGDQVSLTVDKDSYVNIQCELVKLGCEAFVTWDSNDNNLIGCIRSSKTHVHATKDMTITGYVTYNGESVGRSGSTVKNFTGTISEVTTDLNAAIKGLTSPKYFFGSQYNGDQGEVHTQNLVNSGTTANPVVEAHKYVGINSSGKVGCSIYQFFTEAKLENSTWKLDATLVYYSNDTDTAPVSSFSTGKYANPGKDILCNKI